MKFIINSLRTNPSISNRGRRPSERPVHLEPLQLMMREIPYFAIARSETRRRLGERSVELTPSISVESYTIFPPDFPSNKPIARPVAAPISPNPTAMRENQRNLSLKSCQQGG